MAASSDGATARPNILWIITDDMGVETSCYGVKGMKTPNIDQLARDGVRYTRCFTTAPVCSPSRSAIMAAMYQTTINAHDHRCMVTLPEGVKPITDYFRKAGYFTCNIKTTGTDLESHGKTDLNFRTEKPFDGEDFTELKAKQPFFAEFQIHEPHRGSWKPSPEDKNQKKSKSTFYSEMPEFYVDPAKAELPPYYPDTPESRQDWARYLGTINYLDTKVGKMLQLLEQNGMATNTIVFFFADNGRCHVRDKQWLYEGGLHIPLIVRWPGQLKPGTVKDDLVSAIDISATSLKLAGVDLPKNIQGQVFFGPNATKRDYIFGARDRCDETVDRIRSVRNDRYKLIVNFMPDRPYMQSNKYKERQYPVLHLLKQLHEEKKLTPAQELFMVDHKPAEELYDLNNDPHEIHNLALDPKFQKVKSELRAALDDWMKSCDDRPDKHGAMRN